MPKIKTYAFNSYLYSSVEGLVVDEARTASFHNFMATHPDQKAIKYPKLTGVTPTNLWGTTYHKSAKTDPVWKVVGDAIRDKTLPFGSTGLHIPDSVFQRVPTGTQDRPFLISDKINGYTGFFADVVPNYSTRTFTCSAAAINWHGSNALDYRNPLSNDSRNAFGRGRIPEAMCIPASKIKAAAAAGTDLGYVLEMFFVETNTDDGYEHPMVGAENDKFGWGSEGVRLAVKKDVDLVARGFTGEALSLALSLQRRGLYNGDNSGSSSMLKGEQCSPTYLPYAGTNITPTCLSLLTWEDIVVFRQR